MMMQHLLFSIFFSQCIVKYLFYWYFHIKLMQITSTSWYSWTGTGTDAVPSATFNPKVVNDTLSFHSCRCQMMKNGCLWGARTVHGSVCSLALIFRAVSFLRSFTKIADFMFLFCGSTSLGFSRFYICVVWPVYTVVRLLSFFVE